jgi:hypothetical protein
MRHLSDEPFIRETHLGNVLQSQGVFISVAKGIQAKKEELQAAFETSDVDKVTKIVRGIICFSACLTTFSRFWKKESCK